MKKLPVKCPSCDAPLEVSALSCTNCDTVIKGDYSLPLLLQLSRDKQRFILDFILMGGSLKAMAKKMKKSYPTVRNKLDDLIKELKALKIEES